MIPGPRMLLPLSLAALTLFLSACGGGEGTSSSGSGAAQSPSAPGAAGTYVPKSAPEKHAYEAASAFYGATSTAPGSAQATLKSARSACAAMSPEMQRRIVFAAKATGRGGRGASCTAAMASLLERSTRRGRPLSEGVRIVGLKVSGDTAVATVQNPDGKTSRIRLVKEGGRWKVAAPGE